MRYQVFVGGWESTRSISVLCSTACTKSDTPARKCKRGASGYHLGGDDEHSTAGVALRATETLAKIVAIKIEFSAEAIREQRKIQPDRVDAVTIAAMRRKRHAAVYEISDGAIAGHGRKIATVPTSMQELVFAVAPRSHR